MKFHRNCREVLILAVLLGLVSACSREKEGDKLQEVPTRLFKVHGIVQEIKPDENMIIIDHAEIPDYMGAMIMPFKVKELSELIGLESGDEIRFDYRVQELQSWIENIQVTGNKGEVKTESGEGSRKSLSEILPTNTRLPDYSFIDETGTPVRLSDYRTGVHVLTFVFTRCPVPEYCPAMMRNFAKAKKRLETAADAPSSWSLLTISFDVDYDTPDVMKAWGKIHGFESGSSWHLLSARKGSDTIQKISADVGLKFGENQGSYQHNLRTVVLDPKGRIRHVFTDESWTVDQLIKEMEKASIPLEGESGKGGS